MSLSENMRQFVIKKREKDKNPKDNVSTFIIDHLPRNFGVTLGNVLKRTLTDFIPCIALCGVQIWDDNGIVKTEWSTIKGSNLITFYVVTSLKKIVFQEMEERDENRIFSFFLEVESKENESVDVTAGQFVSDDDGIRINNPDLVITTLSPNSSLKIILYCRKKEGYVPSIKQRYLFESLISDKIMRNNERFNKLNGAQECRDYDLKNSVIVLDTNYSPIKDGKIFPLVEQTVISLTDGEEKLSIDIETNGSLSPEMVMSRAINVLYDVFNVLKEEVEKIKK